MKKNGEDILEKSFVKPFTDSKGNKCLETQAYVEIGTVHSFLPGLLPLYLFSVSCTRFQFFLWLQEDNKQLNFQDLNTVLVPCRSYRNSFSPPLRLIREKDSVITNINATQKTLGTCEVKKYKVPPKKHVNATTNYVFCRGFRKKEESS